MPVSQQNSVGRIRRNQSAKVAFIAIISVMSTALLTAALTLVLLLRISNQSQAGALPSQMSSLNGAATTAQAVNPPVLYGDVLRFIRIKHGGVGWDDGMAVDDAEILWQFREFRKVDVAKSGEAIDLATLGRFPKDDAPPFVFLTGSGPIEGLRPGDIAVLRDYLSNGGMLFVNAGSPSFDQSFRSLMHDVYPDRPLVDFAKEDPIFQGPFYFPDGATAHWMYGGNRAVGIRTNYSDLSVFYYPGDLHSAWRKSYESIAPAKHSEAIKMGLNIIYHAIRQTSDRLRQTQISSWKVGSNKGDSGIQFSN